MTPATANAPVADVVVSEVTQTLGILCTDASVELRVLPPSRDEKIVVKRFANHSAAAEWAAKWDTSARGIYVVMNSYDETRIKGWAVSDAAITRRRWLLIDVDPVRDDPDTNSTDAELELAIATATKIKNYLIERGWPAPIEALSGNGAHLLFAIDLPNDDASRQLVSAILANLARQFDVPGAHVDTEVSNASRITKLYGTVARKGHQSTADRPHRRSFIVCRPDPVIVPPAQLQAIAVLNPTKPKTIAAGSRNDTLFREGCRLRRRGAEQAEIAAALRAVNLERCNPPLDIAEVEAIAHSCMRYEPSGDSFRLTEIADAECFAERYGERVRYDHLQGRWLLFSAAGIWIPDPTELLRGFAVETMRERQKAALALIDEDKRKQALKFTLDGESTRRINNALREARALPPIADDGTNWDTQPFLLGVQNGVVDLRTGTLRTGTPEDRITMRARVVYDPEATCPLWEKTIGEVFADDRELIDYNQRGLGYSLTGDCREECFFTTWGEGGNGKGTLMNTVSWVLGDYADDLPFCALEVRERAGIPADIAKLVGKRFVTASESGETTHLNEARIKALTGRDPITARFLHKNFFTFQPVAKFWLATNKKPIVRDDSDGFWRRVHLIPFTQSFVGRADKHLKDRLREEAPGILAWLVRGALAWQRDGLNPPEIVRAATEAYRRESEPLTPFFEERCVLVECARVKSSELFAAYQSWADESRVKDWQRLNQKTFGTQMRKRFEVIDGKNVFYVGVGLKATAAGEPSREGELGF